MLDFRSPSLTSGRHRNNLMITSLRHHPFPRIILIGATLLSWTALSAAAPAPSAAQVLTPEAFKPYVEKFNAEDDELYANAFPNAMAWDFLAANIPLFQCPDEDLERTYYFRWWTYRKHVRQSPDGWVITEFLPKVPWSAKDNTICCPAGHHFYEGRWLADAKYLDDYAAFWFRKGGNPRYYSFWAADAIYAYYLVKGNQALVTGLLDDLIKNYEAWEQSHLTPDGLFWQIDDRDGMEVSIGKSGKRATINSYMFGDATAIARIAGLAGRKDVAATYQAKAEHLKQLVQTKLWDPEAKFFKTLPRTRNELTTPTKSSNIKMERNINDGEGASQEANLVDVRELHGFTPWYFNLPDVGKGYEVAWKQLMDPKGFMAPFGPTTAEQRHPAFKISYEGHGCQWNGPSWPFATAVTLTAMANVLHNSPQDSISKEDYLRTLLIYAKSQRRKLADGRVVSWIDENLDPFTGEWIARKRCEEHNADLVKKGQPDKVLRERGKDYNHSSFCDLVITGVVGLRPRADNVVEIHPLVPDGKWDWFCLDKVFYHGRSLTILWDKTGTKYNKGSGLRVFADGREIARSETLARVAAPLPE